MPDPFFVDEMSDWLGENRGACQEFLRCAGGYARSTLLKAARESNVNLLGSDLALELLLGSSVPVRSEVIRLLREGGVSLTIPQVRRWALEGNHAAVSGALRHMARHPEPEFRSIITEVPHRGWHLYQHSLYDAIVANDVTELTGQLRGLLQGQPVDLRKLAEKALSHLSANADG